MVTQCGGNKTNLKKNFQKAATWRVKVKCTLVQAMRLCTGRTVHRGSRGIALPFLNHGTRRGWGVSVTPRPLFTPGRDPVPIVQEAGWAPGPVWTGAENLAPTEIRSPGRPARSQSIYQLRYPAHSHLDEWGINPLMLHLEIKWWWVVSLMQWPLDPLHRPQKIMELEAVGALELVRTVWRRKKSIAPGRNQSMIPRTSSPQPSSLCSLWYPGYQTEMYGQGNTPWKCQNISGSDFCQTVGSDASTNEFLGYISTLCFQRTSGGFTL